MSAHHIVPAKLYVAIFLTLMVMTALTIWVATLDLGPLNAAAALAIALFKAILVILIFMHVRYSSRLVWIFAGVGFFWLAILITLTSGDYLSRGW